MRFRIRSLERAQKLSKDLKRLLPTVGKEATLTECQAALARCLGYASWSEMRADAGGEPSPLDEDAGMEAWKARIEVQCRVLGDRFGLSPALAAGVAKAWAPTSRARSDDPGADVVAFLPWPRASTGAPDPAPEGDGLVEVHVLQWEESEAGWGTRPDGFTVHGSPADAKAFVDAYWARMPAKVPDEYSRPCSDVVGMRLPADHPAVVRLREGRSWLWGDDARAVSAVWKGGNGGWVSVL